MAISPTSGTKIYIGPTTAAATVSAYAALSYVEITPVESIGDFGDEASTVEFTALGDARVRKRKGVRNAGDTSIICGWDPLDLGQKALITAEATDFAYAIKVLLADGADANDTDSAFYFHALVASARLSGLQANQITKRNYNLLIDTAIFSKLSVAVT